MSKYFFALVLISSRVVGQQIVFPTTENWNHLKEGQTLSFQLSTTEASQAHFSFEGGSDLGISLDTLGHFNWTPSYDLVDRLEKQKDVTVYFQAVWKNGNKILM